MGNTMKNFLKSVGFLAGLLVLFVIFSKIMLPKTNLRKDGFYNQRANGIISEPADTIDALFIGDSESFCAFCPPVIWREQGITSYVCGTAGQKLFYTEELLHTAFKTQSPKVVIMETNAIFRQFEYTDSVKNKLELVLPVFRYHNRWKQFKLSDLYKKSVYVYIEKAKGYKYSAKCVPADTTGYMEPSNDKKPISDRNKKYIEEMANFCKENGAQFILLSSPSTKNWNYMKHNSVKELAINLGVEYIDTNLLMDEIKIDWNTDTRDKGDHMNYYGAIKVSKYVGEYLANMNIFADKRKTPSFDNWNRDTRSFFRDVKKLQQ